MNIAIVEDEYPAAEKLVRFLTRYDVNIHVVIILQSVAESIRWFKNNLDTIDLIFMDIQLSDGKSFSIFNEVDIAKPIIFTTAFDEYALKAFEVNSIAYLLKPIAFDDLSSAMDKLKLLKGDNINNSIGNFNHLLRDIAKQKNYKSRFMVKIGGHIRSITVEKILFFYAEGRNAYITTNEGRRLIIDYKLEELEGILNPNIFFRVNRTFIINIDAINDVLIFTNSRLKIITTVKPEKEIIVSREKVVAFKQWFGGE